MDKAKAVEWYTKAAEQGHADAQDKLGDLSNDHPNLHINVACNSHAPSELNPTATLVLNCSIKFDRDCKRVWPCCYPFRPLFSYYFRPNPSNL